VYEPSLAVFHTVNFFGFYLPPLLLWALAALLPYTLLRRAFGLLDLDRYVWHRSLFNLALYVLSLGGLILAGNLLWL